MNPSAHQPASAQSWRELVEGRAKFALPTEHGLGPNVFYNPRMTLNRDLAILFASSHFPSYRQLRLCDPMAASGIRAARYVLESQNVVSVLAADNLKESVGAATRTISLNGLSDKVSVVESEANLLLLNHATRRFDLVDLDPFGSPAPFFENALRATIDGGVIAATATDMGPLSGARASACIRKYGVRPIRSEFAKEMAVRTLVASLATIAGRLELGIEIAFSHASDHYARIYAKVLKGTKPANAATRLLGFIEYCPECLKRSEHNKLESVSSSCPDCGAKTRIGGPIWLGPLWDGHTVQAMIERTPELHSFRLSEVQSVLACIDQEREGSAFHYTTEAFSQRLGLKPPALRKVLDSLQRTGFKATKTHFSPSGFRTNALCKDIGSIFQALNNEL